MSIDKQGGPGSTPPKNGRENIIDSSHIIINQDEILGKLPHSVRESETGKAFSSILEDIQKSEEGFDKIYFSDFLARFGTYCQYLKSSDDGEEIENTFVVSGIVNRGKGALVVPPEGAHHPFDMKTFPDFAKHLEELKLSNEKKNEKYIRYDLSEITKKIIIDAFRKIHNQDVILSEEALYDEDTNVGGAHEGVVSVFSVIKFDPAYMHTLKETLRKVE